MKKLNNRLINVLLILLFLIMPFSCCSKRMLSTSNRDSVRIETKIRTEYIKDTVIFEVPIEVKQNKVKDTVSILETSLAYSKAEIDSSGYLHHLLQNKEKNVTILTQKKVIYKDSIVYRDKLVENVVEVPRELTNWQQIRLNGFWILLAIFLAFSIIKIRKLFP